MIITGKTNVFLEPNTDTDVIIPARFLKRTALDGFEPFAFFEKRYHSDTVCRPSLEEKDFVFEKKIPNDQCTLNHPNSRNATFLITWFNFGCGSSREHAVYALNDYRVIIGSAPKGKTAFADIFRDNCRQNLIRTPVISPEDHGTLMTFINNIINQQPVELLLDTEKKIIASNDPSHSLPHLPYELPDHHEEYILKGETPLVMAQKSIRESLTSIDQWNQQHQEVLDQYPRSV